MIPWPRRTPTVPFSSPTVESSIHSTIRHPAPCTTASRTSEADIMFRITLKELAAKKLRLLSTALAVFLGVAFLAGTLVLTDTVMKTFDGVLADAHDGTDAYVRGDSQLDLSFGEQRPRLDSALLDRIREVDGVDQVAINVTGYAQLIDKSGALVGDAQNAPTFGLNWVGVDSLNPYKLAEGRGPVADDEIVIDKNSA